MINTIKGKLISGLTCMIFLQFSCSSPAGSRNGQAIEFDRHVLTTDFIAEGVAVADVNGDGKPDILSGAFWFEAPDWKKHELSEPKVHVYNKGYSEFFLGFSQDVNRDGRPDLIRIGWPGQPAHWLENPGNNSNRWKEYQIHPAVGNESPAFIDIDGDGREDLLGNDPSAKKVIWIKSPAAGSATWTPYTISANPDLATHMYTHGIGYGDINGDGRKDVVIKSGWWEGPEDPKTENWTFHPANLGNDCAQMYVLDLNQDGRNDVISSSAHQYGIWWHEQVLQADGSIQFKQHRIDSSFSQSHALMLADINGDGHPDLITGKRYYAHNGGDPGAEDPAELNWYAYHPGKTPTWTKHSIDTNSGSGLNIVVQDMDKDGRPDIVVANKKGLFYFKQK